MRYIKILPIIGLAAALMSCDKPSRKHEPVKEEERQAVVFEPLNIITGATEFQVDYTHDGKVDVEIQIFYDENGKTIKKVENYLSTKRKEDFIWEYAYQGNGKVKELRYDSNGDGKFDLVLRYDKVGNMYGLCRKS